MRSKNHTHVSSFIWFSLLFPCLAAHFNINAENRNAMVYAADRPGEVSTGKRLVFPEIPQPLKAAGYGSACDECELISKNLVVLADRLSTLIELLNNFEEQVKAVLPDRNKEFEKGCQDQKDRLKNALNEVRAAADLSRSIYQNPNAQQSAQHLAITQLKEMLENALYSTNKAFRHFPDLLAKESALNKLIDEKRKEEEIENVSQKNHKAAANAFQELGKYAASIKADALRNANLGWLKLMIPKNFNNLNQLGQDIDGFLNSVGSDDDSFRMKGEFLSTAIVQTKPPVVPSPVKIFKEDLTRFNLKESHYLGSKIDPVTRGKLFCLELILTMPTDIFNADNGKIDYLQKDHYMLTIEKSKLPLVITFDNGVDLKFVRAFSEPVEPQIKTGTKTKIKTKIKPKTKPQPAPAAAKRRSR